MSRVFLSATGHALLAHDTAQYVQLQYIMFTEAAFDGHVPGWLPFMTHGTVANTWELISQGLLASPAYLLAPLLRWLNVLDLSTIGIVFDQCVLLLGTILLGRRCYRSKLTVSLIAAAVICLGAPSTQIWWNFHILYLLPLTLYCAEVGIRGSSPRYLYIAGILLTASLLGNLPYFLPITLFCIVTYGCANAALFFDRTRILVAHVSRTWCSKHIAAVAVPAALGILILLFAIHGALTEVVYGATGRSSTGEVATLEDFLTYGGSLSAWKYLELIARTTNNLDSTLYLGIAILPFLGVALICRPPRRAYAFVATAMTMFLLSSATFVSVGFFYLFPFGHLFRHIGLLGPLVCLFLAFYAGYGFDAFIDAVRQQTLLPKHRLWLGLAISLSLLLVVTLSLARLGVITLVDVSLWSNAQTLNQPLRGLDDAQRALVEDSILAAAFSAIIAVLLIQRRHAAALLPALVAIQVIDVLVFTTELDLNRTPIARAAVHDLFTPAPPSFAMQRTQNYGSNSRFQLLAPYLLNDEGSASSNVRHYNTPPANVGPFGSVYWSTDSFTRQDAIASVFRTDYRLRSVDAFHQIWNANAGTGTAADTEHIGFPLPESPAFWKLVGATEPKVQMFSRIRVERDRTALVAAMSDKDNTGDIVTTTADDSALRSWPSQVQASPAPTPWTDDRLVDATSAVLDFTFDSLTLRVSVPGESPAILYYADGWHPEWHATVNGTPVAIAEANLGYKAIVVPPGNSIVEFRFGDFSRELLVTVSLLTGTLAVIAILLTVGDLGKRESGGPSADAKVWSGAFASCMSSRGGDPAPLLIRFAPSVVLVLLFGLMNAVATDYSQRLPLPLRLTSPALSFTCALALGLCSSALLRRCRVQDRLRRAPRVVVRLLLSALVVLAVLDAVIAFRNVVCAQPQTCAIPTSADSGSLPVLVDSGYRGYNIIRQGSVFYGIRQGDGNFDLTRFIAGDFIRGVSGPTLKDVQLAIDQQTLVDRSSALIPTPQLIAQGYAGYNILRYDGSYIALRQQDGDFDPQRFRANQYPVLFSSSTLTGLLNRVSGSPLEEGQYALRLGFYPSEDPGDNPLPRWTYPTSSIEYVPAESGSLTLDVRLVQPQYGDRAEPGIVLINDDTPVQLNSGVLSEVDPGRFVLHLELGTITADHRIHRIELLAPVFVPAQADQTSSDTRTLGVRIESIGLTINGQPLDLRDLPVQPPGGN
ncbi:MAG: hypothetical protein JOZ65_15720 [Chloroflexi bacterium]|nr:hypothetical protein [Chloroflexota bacterium]